MARRVHLHIGAPKSGTTYLQTILWGNRDLLREAGVLVPGRGLVDYNRAAVAMRVERQGDGLPVRTWRAMLEEVHAFDGDAVLSGEWFCRAPAHLVGRTIEQLAPAEVSVVFSARAFVSQVPAAWQESLKRGNPVSLDDFVDRLWQLQRRWSWANLDARVVLERWTPHVPVERIAVVTVPRDRREPDALLTRFSEALSFPREGLVLGEAARNESLSVESAELLRKVAPRVQEVIDFSDRPWADEYRWMRRYLAHELFVPQEGHRIALRRKDVSRLRRRSQEVADWARTSGVRVVGDLDDLVEVGNPEHSLHPSKVDAAAQLERAVPVIAQLLHDLRATTLAAEDERKERA